MWVKYLALVSGLFTMLPLVVALCRFPCVSKPPMVYLLLYFAGSACTEVVCYVLMQKKIPNGMVFNLFSLAEACCFYLYYRHGLVVRRFAVTALFATCLLALLVIYTGFDPVTAFSLKARFTAQFFLLLLSLLCLLRLGAGARGSITRHYSFWVSVAIQVYVMGNLFYFLSFNLLLGTPARHLIHIALNVAYNLLLIWPLLTKKRISG